MTGTEDIIFEEIDGHHGKLGLITLNKPQVLNALNQAMFLALDERMAEWETAEHIKAVVIRAVEGRAFSAGGDIRSAYQRGMKKDPTLPDFFADEYRLDTRIYHYPKPYIALLDGITMGGGVGISINGSYRVATERMSFAMPETGIGFYPDIGASYFLPRLPHKIGFYLGLTGERIAANDCLAIGLVDQVVEANAFPDIIQKLADACLRKHPEATIADLIKYFSKPVEKSELMNHQMEIETCFSKNSVEEIFQTLQRYPTVWCEQTANVISKKSPTSLKITLRQLQLGAKMTFDKCMEMEYRLTCRFLESHDFYEGVRAAIIDKDQAPVWKPAKLEEVRESDIEKYFAKAVDAEN